MKPGSYTKALDEVLRPMGFERDGKRWSRICGDVLEEVELQVSQIAGATANLWTKDLATETLLREAIPWVRPLFLVQLAKRIGHLIDGRDRWWLRDPNGPAELAAAIRAHAQTYFESERSLEAQALRNGRKAEKWSVPTSRIYLALTLYRMGELDEACRALRNPPKGLSAKWLAELEGVRQRIGCAPTTDPTAPEA